MISKEGARPPRQAAEGAGPAPRNLRCLQCGRPGASASPTGALCPVCAAAIAAEAQRRVRILQESLHQLKEESTVPGKLGVWDRILAEIEALEQYEVRGILTTCPPPSTLLQEFQAQREALARSGEALGAAER
jgi:hypothetical protein